MSSNELNNLTKTGALKAEPGDQKEFDGLLASARTRLADAQKTTLALESQFDLTYNAGHALSLAAMRWHGYRPGKRYIVFQSLAHTLGLGPEVWRVLDKAHGIRNSIEYEGQSEVTKQMVLDLHKAVQIVRDAVEKLGPISAKTPGRR
jgi:hypothetical protein